MFYTLRLAWVLWDFLFLVSWGLKRPVAALRDTVRIGQVPDSTLASACQLGIVFQASVHVLHAVTLEDVALDQGLGVTEKLLRLASV